MTSVLVVGAGLIGSHRLEALNRLGTSGFNIDVVGVVDPRPRDELQVPERVGHYRNLHDGLGMGPEWVIVATPHDAAIGAVASSMNAGANVLVEKPLGRTAAEARALAHHAEITGRRLHVGMNYRFFEGVRSLLVDCSKRRFGDLVSLEVELGHGGAPGDEQTWKLDRARAGGGCLIDPGIHVLDLAMLVAGDLAVHAAASWNGFWRTGIEEEAHVLLTGAKCSIVQLSISIVRWRSTFRLQVNGTDGYGVVTGRGRSYGAQSYRRGERWGWRRGGSQRETEEEVVTTDGDSVWADELRSLLVDERAGGGPGVASAAEAVGAMELLDRIRDAAGVEFSATDSRHADVL